MIRRFERILVVDDSEADQLLAELAIRAYDPDTAIRQAADGAEALTVLADSAFEPQLILLDINMPRMGGLEFLETFCGGGLGRPIVVMLTSSDQTRDRERARAYDCVVDYRVKPLQAATLRELERLLDRG